ncbi:hypothetical protein ACLBKT_03575 [Erythrobacter sp. W302b]|uniref:hypothetical protein n=1 Tax=Erythrobacter sp. W302b TaxID=3389874 RepID=UPI00396B2AF0
MTSWINVVAAVAGATVQTAPPPAPPSDPIIVEGEKVQSEQALSELARDIAGNPRPRRPLARFERPLCLMVAAADTALGQQVAERIIENARDARVPVRGKGCKPNALLALSDNAQAQLRDVKASGRRLFAGLSAREIDAALGARDPVYVFQASRQASNTGEPIVNSPEAAGPNGLPGPPNKIWSAGRLKRDLREDMLAALVVVDNAAVAGLTPIQIADYASLRLLAPTGEVDLAEAGAPHTIMTLFVSPQNAPQTLSRFDRAYLKALYRLPAGSFASEVLRAAVLETARSAEQGDD